MEMLQTINGSRVGSMGNPLAKTGYVPPNTIIFEV